MLTVPTCRFRLAVVTIVDFFGVGLPSSLAGGGAAVTTVDPVRCFEARWVTTEGPACGVAFRFCGGRL